MVKGKSSDSENMVFVPGCALMLYKPDLAGRIYGILNKNLGMMDMLLTCCQHDPGLPANSKVINVCPGCDRRFGMDYPGVSTVSLWEILDSSDFFPFPDYHGLEMSIVDACPTREETRIHKAIRSLLNKMNITLVEPENTRTSSTCCGDSYYGLIPKDKVIEQMLKRASEMPRNEVAVYCISCIKAVFNGRKKPRYLIDLLFNQETDPKPSDPDIWHTELRQYIEEH